MKRFILFVVVVLSLSLFVAADEPPSFSNHQFYGDVNWDSTTKTPTTVTAKIGSAVFPSSVKSSPCLDAICKGTYGYDLDNILRVQGKTGDKIELFVDATKVAVVAYKSGESTKLDLDVTAAGLAKGTTSKTSASSNTGSSGSSGSSSSKSSGSGSKSSGSSGTIVKQKPTSAPVDTGTGPAGSAAPSFPAVVETCNDGVQNQNEEGVDCGGVCEECKSSFDFGIWIYVGAGVILLVIVLAIVFYIRGKNAMDPGVKAELERIYAQGAQRGMSKEQITQGLVQRGWDPELLKKF